MEQPVGSASAGELSNFTPSSASLCRQAISSAGSLPDGSGRSAERGSGGGGGSAGSVAFGSTAPGGGLSGRNSGFGGSGAASSGPAGSSSGRGSGFSASVPAGRPGVACGFGTGLSGLNSGFGGSAGAISSGLSDGCTPS